MLEHHSNDLPWRARFRTVHVGVCPDGTLDVDDLDRRLAEHAGRVALLAVSGASNVTGVVQPVHELADEGPCRRRPHPRRRRPTRPAPPDRHAGPRRSRSPRLRRPLGPQDVRPVRHWRPRRARVARSARTPDHAGGGTVNAVTTDTVAWADLPDREEAGSPNVLGAVALAAATRALTEIGLDRIAAHESELTRYAIDRLAAGARPQDPRTDRHLRPDRQARRHPVHHRRDRPRPDRRGPRLRARRRRAQRMLLRPSIHRPPPQPRPNRRDGLGRPGAARRQARGAGHGPDQLRLLQRPARRRSSPSPRWSRSSPATSLATTEPTSTARIHPVGYVEPTLYSLDAP